MSKQSHLETTLIHTGDGQNYKRPALRDSVPETLPIYASSVFSFDDGPSVEDIYEGRREGYIYSRMRNPSSDAAAEIIAAADGAEEGLVFSSGMAAITTSLLAVLSPGDQVVASPVLYGGVYSFLKNELTRLGVKVTFADLVRGDPEELIPEGTKLVYTETISNPLMEVPDLARISKAAHDRGALFYVDNTFATSVVARPLAFGADLVLHSATKYLSGHSDIVAGSVSGGKELIETIRKTQVLYGPTLGAYDSWLLARSLRTLSLRVQKQSQNALAIAKFLSSHPQVEQVYYSGLPDSPFHERARAQFVPGLYGGMVSFTIRGGEKEAFDFIKALSTIHYVPSLAGTATTLSYPIKTSHRASTPEELKRDGISAGLIRLSAGLEDPVDLIHELDEALRK